MTSLKAFEKEALEILLSKKIQSKLLSEILETNAYKLKHTGAGYFLTINDDRLSVNRLVFNKPSVLGVGPDGLECGVIVFIEENTMTLECHPYTNDLPEDFREHEIKIQV